MVLMKFIDMFAGIGGFRTGLENTGHKCVGFIEWDKYARMSYQAMYDTKGEFTANDIQQVKGADYQQLTFGLLEAHVKTSVLLENKKGSLKVNNPACSLRLSDSLKNGLRTKKRYLPISSWKMLKLSYPAMEDGILQGSSLKWTKSGTMQNGQFLTLPMSSLRTEKEYILSDILEKQVPDQYFLSQDKAKLLLQQQKSKS